MGQGWPEAVFIEMIQPTKKNLEAMAGWALSKRRHGQCSSEQNVALGRFQDGCHDLAQCVEGLQQSRVNHQSVTSTRRTKPRTEPGRDRHPTVPVEVQQYQGVEHPEGACNHKFHIKTQRCVYCGLTYREVKGCEPQFM